MKRFYNSKSLALGVFVVSIVAMLLSQMYAAIPFLRNIYGYQVFQISDWLINYQGGFVRRGLLGEGLYQLYCLHPYPVVYVIAGIYYISLIIFICLFVRLLVKQGLSIFLLPSLIMLFYAIGGGFIACRRDYIALLLTLYIYYAYFLYLRQYATKYWFCFSVLSVLTLLIHEASFFFTFPILIVHHLLIRKERLFKTFGLFLPVGLTMCLVSYYKGSTSVAETIWDSWMPALKTFPLNGDLSMGYGVGFLSKELYETLGFHMNITWIVNFKHPIASIIGNLYVFVASYYLVTRMNVVSIGSYKLKSINTTALSTILIIQFVFVSPLFGFLSCDLGRTIPYWIISVLMFYCLHQRYNSDAIAFAPLSRLNAFSTRVQEWISRKKWLANPYLYILCVLTLPLKFYGEVSMKDSMLLLHILRTAKQFLVYCYIHFIV